LTKRVVRDAGVPTAAFQVVTGAVAPPPFDPPYFIKPVAEGTGKGVSPASIIRRREELAGACRAMQARFRQPVLVEAFLPGREFTVGIVGTDSRAEAIGTIEVHLRPSAEAEVYSYVNKERYKELVEYRLVHPEEDPVVAEGVRVALEAWRVLGCRDGGRVDIRCDGAGRPQFMEVNPLAGLHPEHSDLPIIATRVGLSFQDLVARILDAALERVPPAGGRAPGEL
jgi:D-alanine-D-alanine ligase